MTAATTIDAGAVVDSMTVAACTVVSRLTGLLRVVVIGAVLGPSLLGNTYQFSNSLPNLLYYGLLAGSLFASLLVPALVPYLDRGRPDDVARIAGGFLGVSLLGLLPLVAIALFAAPAALAATSSDPAQQRLSLWLLLMLLPQVFLYAAAGTCAAAQNASRRFALAAAAPAIENLGTLLVLAVAGLVYAPVHDLGAVPTGEVVLLGAGSTAAVALHAGTQWWGARRAGLRIVPSRGWSDDDVRVLLRRARPALAQAGLYGGQLIVLLLLANRAAGGIVALQVALNLYALPISLVAVPVALALLPRLARNGPVSQVADGLSLALLFAVPAGVGMLVLARPLARTVAFGQLSGGNGVTLVAAACASLALAVVAQTAFQVGSYACYAVGDPATPLRAMRRQALTCLTLATAAALELHGVHLLLALGTAFSLGLTTGALTLHRRLGTRGCGRSAAVTVVGALVMAWPAWLVAHSGAAVVGARPALLVAVAVGAAVFLASQALLHNPQLTLARAGLGRLRGRAAR